MIFFILNKKERKKLVIEAIRKESKIFKEEIKKIDTVIKTKQNNSFKDWKTKIRKRKKKNFEQIKKIDKIININELYEIQKQIEKNREEILKLKNQLPNKQLQTTYMIKKWKENIVALDEEISKEMIREEKLDSEIRVLEVEGTNIEQQIENFNAHDLNKKLILSKLKLKTARLAVKLERRTYKTKRIFCKIARNELEIANKFFSIKQENWWLCPNLKLEKEVLDARLKIRLKLKMENICDLNRSMSRRNLDIAKIDKKIAKLNVSINKKNIEINGCLATVRQIYNSQSIKTQIKILLKSPFIWLNKQFQKYKYEVTLNQYQAQLEKLEKEIQKLETDKGGRNFSNKFWVIISCGRFNNSRSNEIKQQKIAKLYEIKQKISGLRSQATMQSQPSTSRHAVSWNEMDPDRCFNEIGYNDNRGFTSSF